MIKEPWTTRLQNVPIFFQVPQFSGGIIDNWNGMSSVNYTLYAFSARVSMQSKDFL